MTKINKAIKKVFNYLLSLSPEEFEKELDKKSKNDYTDILMKSGFIDKVEKENYGHNGIKILKQEIKNFKKMSKKEYNKLLKSVNKENVKPITVYGIHTGSVYEGGCMEDIIYRNYDDAIKRAKKIVKDRIKEQKELYPTKKDRELFKPVPWKETMKNYWDNKIDCVVICELELR